MKKIISSLALVLVSLSYANLAQAAINKMLVVGNSITRHLPSPKVEWPNDWGMAATAKDKDWVHTLQSHIAGTQGGKKPEVKIADGGSFERAFAAYDVPGQLTQYNSFKPDVIVVFVGDNVNDFAKDIDQYGRYYDRMLSFLKSKNNPRLYCVSTWWASSKKDDMMQQACEKEGGKFVNISDLFKDSTNRGSHEGKYNHDGVARHPGDKGMQQIAQRIFGVMVTDMNLKSASTTTRAATK